MSHDLQALEASLRALRPAAPGPELAARLADTARGTHPTLTPAEAAFEASLRQIQPAPVPADLAATIHRRTRAPHPNVVALPSPATRHWSRYMLPLAAAVALLGAATALLIPTQPAATTVATATATPGDPATDNPLPRRSPDFAPAGFSTDLSQTSDEGVLWQAPGQARRVLKVTYRDRVTLVDQYGRKYQVDQPRVEYILVPEKLD